jgi:hypothetical protein
MHDTELVSRIAAEVDRLVWAVEPSVASADKERLRIATHDAGLDSLGFIPNFAEFLLGPGITRDTALTRQRYAPTATMDAWLDSMSDAGLIESDGNLWTATQAGRSLCSLVREVRTNGVSVLWAGHDSAIHELVDTAGRVADNAASDHTIATLYRDLPLPAAPPMALVQRLINLRYLRQHDHAAAWSQVDLTAPEMVVLTELWHGGVVEESPALFSLIDRRLATTTGLTDLGQELRTAIEVETNRLNADDFSILSEDEASKFLGQLTELPSRRN